MSRLPNAEFAVVEIRKLRDYCLSPEHPRGRHKARVFDSVLGLGTSDAEWLREALLVAASSGEATPAAADEYGQRYVLDFDMKTSAGEAIIRSTWIIRRGEGSPRFVSCWVL